MQNKIIIKKTNSSVQQNTQLELKYSAINLARNIDYELLEYRQFLEECDKSFHRNKNCRSMGKELTQTEYGDWDESINTFDKDGEEKINNDILSPNIQFVPTRSNKYVNDPNVYF